MTRNSFIVLLALVPLLAISSVAQALANRVFVSQRSGNDSNACNNILTPCQTFAGAVLQLNPGGEAIVLDSGGYGPVTITGAVTIDAPAGVTAFIHPPSGDAITVNAGSGVVTLRGLVLNGGTGNGITVNSVGTLNVENCFITGFTNFGIQLASAGLLNVKGTDITGCDLGIELDGSAGLRRVSIDHCHLDGNSGGFRAETTSPGSSSTVATYTTANDNLFDGWICGDGTTGKDVLDLEFCTGSGDYYGLVTDSTNAASATYLSNCVFANNVNFGVESAGAGSVSTRGNNTGAGNGSGATGGTIGSFTGF